MPSTPHVYTAWCSYDALCQFYPQTQRFLEQDSLEDSLAWSFAGVATSLKILFNTESCDGTALSSIELAVERNEVIALVNLLERLSKAIEIVRDMSSKIKTGEANNLRGAVEDLTQRPLNPFL